MTDVLIAGSGPTGLTLACDLALRGVAVRVIDQRAAPHRESRGKGLQQSSLEVFEALGVAGAVTAAGSRGVVLRKYFDGEHVTDTPVGDGVLIGQWQIEQVLRDRLAGLGVHVEYGSALAAVTQDADGVRAELADGGVIAARYLAGCDGGRSTTRRLLGIPFEGSTREEAGDGSRGRTGARAQPGLLAPVVHLGGRRDTALPHAGNGQLPAPGRTRAGRRGRLPATLVGGLPADLRPVRPGARDPACRRHLAVQLAGQRTGGCPHAGRAGLPRRGCGARPPHSRMDWA